MDLCISLNIPHRFCRDDVHIVSTFDVNIKKKASQNMLLHACDASHFIHL